MVDVDPMSERVFPANFAVTPPITPGPQSRRVENTTDAYTEILRSAECNTKKQMDTLTMPYPDHIVCTKRQTSTTTPGDPLKDLS